MKKIISFSILFFLILTSCAKKEKRPKMAYENANKGAAVVVDSFDPKGTARQFKKQTDKFYKDTKDIMNGSASKESIYLKDRRISLENQIVDEDGNIKKVEFKIGDLNKKIKTLETLPVTLKFNSIDIKSALRLFAGLVKRNIIIGKDVNAEITLDFQDINWGSAMYVILDMNDLVMTEDANSGLLRVDTKKNFVEAVKSKVNITKELASLATGTVPGATTTQADGDAAAATEEETFTEIFRVFHNQSQQMSGTLGAVIEGITIQNDELNNQLFVTATKEQLDEVEKVLNKIDTPKQAVMIEAYIVNASDGFAESFDANLQAGAGVTARTVGNNITQVEVASPGIEVSAPNVGGGDDFEDVTIKGGMMLIGNLGAAQLQAVINASINDTNSEAISNPKLFAMNGQAANVTQGVTIKKTIAGSASAASETVDVALNLSLNVTPRIRGDKIELTVAINNSSPGETDASGVGATDIPVNTEAVNSTIQISDGDVAILGGVYSSTKTDNNNRVPLLSRIPVLGTFFETETKSDNRSQLLIFITARIV